MSSVRLLAILVSMFCILLLNVRIFPAAQAECQGGFAYLIEADDGGHYALIGLSSGLRSQFANHTQRITVDGTFFPSNPNEFLHPEPNFRGVIYVTRYFLVSAMQTSTYSNPTQVSPTTITAGTGSVTLAPIEVSGILDYTTQYCVTPMLTATSTFSTGGNLTQPIPGFTIISIILGMLIGVSFLGIVRGRARRSARDFT